LFVVVFFAAIKCSEGRIQEFSGATPCRWLSISVAAKKVIKKKALADAFEQEKKSGPIKV
jgi:hypothetical protein